LLFSYQLCPERRETIKAGGERDSDIKLKGEKGKYMTREDIKKHFPDATDDQISALLDINSRDIGKHKTAAETAQKELAEAKNTILDLEKNKGDVAALQKTIDEYKAADEKRQADEKTAAERADRLGRFDKAHAESGKDRKWLNDYTKNGIFAEFEKALADEANKGKSDAQIYASLVNDEKGVKPGLFQAQVTGGYMPGMGSTPSGDQAYIQAKYKNNPFVTGAI
jgi:hypothetical protein